MIDPAMLAAAARLGRLAVLLEHNALPRAASGATATQAHADADPAGPAAAQGSARDAMAQSQLPGRAPAAAFSAAARLLGTLPAPDSSPVRTMAPLAPAGAAPEVLAGALRDAIASSGLFYESHLAEWAAGQRPAASLRAEPQAAWTPRETPAAPAAASRTLPAAAPDVARREVPGPDVPRPDALRPEAAPRGETAADAAPGTPPEARAAAPEAAVPAPGSRPLVAQQLAVHEHRRFEWTGEAWPGQQVAVTFAEDDAAAAQTARGFTVHIVTTLPDLGRVASTLRLEGGTLSVALRADERATAGLLQAARDALRTRLAAAGVPAAIAVEAAA